MKLSKKALEVLSALFSEESQLQFPAGLAEYILEIRKAVREELENLSKKENV
jgi:hypothetical protein